MTDPARPDLRTKARQLLKDQLAELALEMFETTGFDEVTVADITQAAGISQRSFFRYFPSKEDVVLGDRIPTGAQIRDELRRHIDGRPVWEALRQTVQTVASHMDADQAHWKPAMRVTQRTPSLRARNLEKHLAWSADLVPEVLPLVGGGRIDAELAAQTIVTAALGCFDIAISRWANPQAQQSLVALVDEVFRLMTFAGDVDTRGR